jgi:uncharacterized surface protein with fasciclin (FAS1) repeats
MKTLKLNAFALIAFLAIGISSCSKDDDKTTTPTPPADTTITGLAVATPNLSTLVKALTRAGLAGTLQGTTQYTAFAPTNDAFTAFFASLGPNVTVDNVDLPTLKKVLLNHVVSGEIKSAAIPASTYVSTLSPFSSADGSPTISMFVQKEGANVYINGGTATTGVKVTTADVDASNGVIHIVNKVIAIPTIVDHVVANPDFDTLQAVVTSTTGAFGDQSAVLGILSGLTAAAPATLFAPNNAALGTATSTGGFAFNASPAQVTKVLQYHATAAGNVRSSALQNNQVVPMITNPVQNTTIILGTGTVDVKDTANNLSRVFKADIQCSNGVIHGVNRVLQPAL